MSLTTSVSLRFPATKWDWSRRLAKFRARIRLRLRILELHYSLWHMRRSIAATLSRRMQRLSLGHECY
jgi:hypothetical protein